jgi:hypothetical protein
MWFVNFVLGAAVAVTLLVLGTAVYIDRTAAQLSDTPEVVPLPRAAPRPPKPQTAAIVDDETVRESPPGKGGKARHHQRGGARRGTR